MDLQTRKIEFVQEFLKVQSEEIIVRLEKILRKENKPSCQENYQKV
jgi:preprotein translocase subunit Sss1